LENPTLSKILTASAVAKMKCGGALPREVPDGGCPHLYLVIYPSGRKAWALRFRRPDRRPAKLVLGSVNIASDASNATPVIGGYLTLAAARRLAGQLIHEIASGKDPAATRQAEKRDIALAADNTFAAATCDFIVQHAKKNNRRWVEQAKLLGLREENGELVMIDRGLAKRWRDKPVGEIDSDTVFRLIEEVRHKGHPGLQRKNSDASEPRARAMHSVLSKMFAWLLEKRRVKSNPLAVLKRPSAPESRDRVLAAQEIVAFWKSAGELRPPFGALMRLLLLTGCRLNEVARMEREELSADNSVWTIPGSRTKNHRSHVLPLAALAQSIIADIEPVSERFVFSTTAVSPVSGFSKMKSRLDTKMDGVAAWRIHDLRRSCATGMAEIGVPPHIIELVLNHVSGARAGVAGTYNRSEQMSERKAALERWANHVAVLVSGKAERRVVSLKRAKRAARG
jgi:integrase